MKVYLFNTGNTSEKHFDSINIAIQFSGAEKIEIISDYPMPDFEKENVECAVYDTEKLIERMRLETENVLVAHSQTVFTAEAFLDVVLAHQKFSGDKEIMIQLVINTNMLTTPRPTLPIYGGNRLWLSGTQLFLNEQFNVPVAYGNPKIMLDAITKEYEDKPYFHDFIFYGGDTGLLTAFPPLAFDERFIDLPEFVKAPLSKNEYMNSIPNFPINKV